MAAVHSPVAIEFRRNLYELAAAHPDRDPSMLGQEAWEALEEKPQSKTMRSRANVEMYLSDPDKWSPFLDEIALERAIQFDWKVIDNLTPYEYQELVHRLSEMDDPWDYHISNSGWRKIAKSGGAWSKDLGGALPTIDIRTPRRLAYLAGPEMARRRLTRRVQEKVKRDAEAQAA